MHDEEAELDRGLATVMFTDVVGSTERASALEDRASHEFLAHHDQFVRASAATYRGREIKTLGDGFLAKFDGPARASKSLAVSIEVGRACNRCSV